MDRCCAICRYFMLGTVEPDLGDCRRHAPAPLLELKKGGDPKLDIELRWPAVLAHEWCGDFKILRK